MDLIKQTFIIILAFSASLLSDEIDTYFEQANQFYQQNEFPKAEESYLKIVELGFESGPLYFNLGNVYYRMDEIGKARLYYEKAVNFLEGDDALEQNLDLVKQRLVDQIESPPTFFLFEWWNFVINLFAIEWLAWIVAGLVWLFLFFVSLNMYYRKRGRVGRYKPVLTTLVVILILFSLVLSQKVYQIETERYGVVLSPSVTIYASPNLSGTEVFLLHEGTKVKIERQNNDWFEIKLEDGKTGWIESAELGLI